jgi:putative membrane protein
LPRLPLNRDAPRALLLAALVVVGWSGWSPLQRPDWLLENLLVALALPIIACAHRILPLTKLSYLTLFLFLCLHEVGAHYTYSLVPYREWMHQALSTAIGEEGAPRNQYDRMIHFAYGMLAMPAAIELVARRAAAHGAWRWIFPMTIVMAGSTLYELLEWAAALVVGGELGQVYLGSQGDPWDAQKDMFLATLGSIGALGLLAAARWPRKSGCARESVSAHQH